ARRSGDALRLRQFRRGTTKGPPRAKSTRRRRDPGAGQTCSPFRPRLRIEDGRTIASGIYPPRRRILRTGLKIPSHRVVIVGGGFGGLYAGRVLGRARMPVTVIDRRNFHLFQPLLYQVATGALSPGEIASPLRYILQKYRSVQVLLGDV